MSARFTRQSAQPLRQAHYLAAVRRARELCDVIERNCGAVEPRDKAKLTQAIHNLAMHARTLSDRHRRRLQEPESWAADDYDAGVRE